MLVQGTTVSGGNSNNSLVNKVNNATNKMSSNLMNFGVSTPNTSVAKTTSSSPANVGTVSTPSYSKPTSSGSSGTVSKPAALYNDTLMNKLNAQKDANAAGMTYTSGYSSLGGPEGYRGVGGSLMIDNKDGSKTYYNTDTGQSEVIPSVMQLLNYGKQLRNQRLAEEEAAKDAADKGSGGGSVDYSGQTSYYDDLMKAFMEQNEAARQAMLDSIMKNLDAVKGTYKQQIQNVIDEYQQLIDSNEVNRERTRRRIRENQANRGQLDSGMGRQERLSLDTSYDTNQTNLTSAREAAVNEINNLIAQAEAEAKSNIASVNDNYNNALLQWKLANQ